MGLLPSNHSIILVPPRKACHFTTAVRRDLKAKPYHGMITDSRDLDKALANEVDHFLSKTK